MCNLNPTSRGSIRISSTDPARDPTIRMNYLDSQLDRDVTVEGLKTLRRIYQQPAFKDLWKREVIPGEDKKTDAELLGAIRANATTVYHLVGTCRMGSDARAVLDPRLRVRGVHGLRVVDASVMPEIVSGNTNAPTIMIGERASDLILEDARREDRACPPSIA